MNKSKNMIFKHENIVLILNIITILIAIATLVVSIINHVYAKDRDISDNTEQISVTSTGCYYDEIMTYNCAGGYRGQGLINGITYTIIVSNNSKQGISIISHDIFQETANAKIQYEDMVEQIRDNSNNEILFPLSLDPGESISLTFEINTLISPSINMLLLEKYGPEAEIPNEDLIDYLGEKGLDIFGNEVSYSKLADGNYSMESDTTRFPVYSLELNSSRGNIFRSIITQVSPS